MFEEDVFEPLAELYISLNDCSSDEYLYCLCSRAIIRNVISEEEKVFNDQIDPASNEEVSPIRFLNSSTESQPSTVQNIKKKEQDEVVSCYCSASHYSTDDSTKDALHSDSGADLSESSRDPGWEQYWSKHGEGIIWESWIEKYGEYVDPAYTRDPKSASQSGVEGGSEFVHENNSDMTRLSFCSEVSDSFTNVTPLTLSEISAEESSLLSSSDSTGSVPADVGQWHALWLEHFNVQYLLAYENFKASLLEQSELDTVINESVSGEEIPDPAYEKRSDPSFGKKDLKKKKSYRTKNSVGYLLKHLETINMSQEDSNESGPPQETSSKNPLSISSDSKADDEPLSSSAHESVSELPTPKDKRPKLKRPHEREDDRLRGAFNLIGFSYNGEGVSGGIVEYKKRNIRWQNRMLIMNNHIYFDEDGQIVTKDKKNEKKLNDDKQEQLSTSLEIKSDFSEKDDSSEGEFYSASEESESKREKRKKRKKRKGLPKEILENERLVKFWYQRYRLFSKFDEGIKLDEESWYSVTPEKVSQHTAERCRCDLIVDACCGAGGNTIQFAFSCERVIAIDIDPQKIELAKHNARIYGVEDRIEFIVGDFVKLAPQLQADVVFLSPPWGGLDYAYHKSYHLDRILPPLGGSGLFEVASKITPNIAMFLPKNVNTDELLLLAGHGGSIELEQNFLGKKLVAVTAYFGELCGSYPPKDG